MHAGRYRWDILAGGRVVQSSMDSFATSHEAEVAGRAEMEKLIGARPAREAGRAAVSKLCACP
jgi:hypothetical protein